MIEVTSVKHIGLYTIDWMYYAFASLILLRGVAHKIISEALGHASVAFTMDTYSHIIGGYTT
jgi:site-specific recombinase XerD